MAEAARKSEKSAERDEAGRFLPGCTPGPGRPRGSRAYYRELALEVITPEKWQKAVAQQLRKSERGDGKAFRLIRDLAVGPAGMVLADDEDARPVIVFNRPELRTDLESANIEHPEAQAPIALAK